MTKWVFWDNDGVLVDTEGLYFRASAEVLAGIGIELSRDDFAEISMRQGGSVFSLAEHLFPAAKIDELRRERDRLYSRLLQGGAPVIPGARETLEALHGRVRMAIVTSCRREHFEIIHRGSGLLNYFDFILAREDYVLAKPHPEPYLAALARSGVSPGECVIIEDSPRGFAAARAAGMRCMVVPSPFFPPDQFVGGDLLSGLQEIPAIVLGTGDRVSAAVL